MMIALLARYKLLIEIVLIGALAAGAAYGVHEFLEHERQVGRDEVQSRWDKQQALDKEAARVKEAEFETRLNEAIQNGVVREQTIRTLAAASGNANLGLRDTLAAIRDGVPGATVEALGKSVTALSSVLAKCTGRYIDVAERADRHASDAKTLSDAWPKVSPGTASQQMK